MRQQSKHSSEAVHHPVFARVYARLARAAEARGGAEHRRALLARTSGRVLELGAGAGSNFAHYPDAVDEVVAVEPERHLRERAVRAAAEVGLRVSVHDAKAGALDYAEGSFDAGVVSLVLCTVPDQHQALTELFNVIRPGGTLHFYEHVRAPRRGEARIQDLADATLWPRLAGGCHLGRDTAAAITAAGFELESCERFAFSPARYLPAAPHILGVARRP